MADILIPIRVANTGKIVYLRYVDNLDGTYTPPGGGGGGSGTATDAHQLTQIVEAQASNTLLQDILDELRDDINLSETVWRDATTGAFYIRQSKLNEDTGAITSVWINPNGTTASPNVAGLVLAVANKDFETSEVIYRATANGTGYSNGDLIALVILLDTDTISAGAVWYNATTRGVIASAPPDTDLVPFGGNSDATAANQATQITAAGLTNTKLDTVIGHVDGLEAGLATLETGKATAANQATQITAASLTNTKLDTVIGHVDDLEAGLATLETGKATAANQATQITAAGLTNTKLDTVIGHIDAIETNQATQIAEAQTANTHSGTDVAAAVQQAGGAGVRGWLSGIYKTLFDSLTAATSLFVRMTDGTTNAKVAPASTAPVATDPALIVALSPNSPATRLGTDAVTLVNAVTATGNGTAVDLGGTYSLHGIQLTLSGTVTGLTISLKGSFDGARWDEILSSTSTADGAVASAGPALARFVRADVVSISGAGATVTVKHLAIP
jgi:hypothetical protein